MNTITRKTFISILALATFCVFSHWNIWTREVYAFGFNSTFACLCFILLYTYQDPNFSFQRNRSWLLPIFFIALSFSIYENPWLKTISILLLPIAFGFFLTQSKLQHHQNQYHQESRSWDYSLIYTLISKTISPIKYIFPSVTLFFQTTKDALKTRDSSVLKRVLLGIGILIPLACVSILLLSSADQNFNQLVENFVLNISDYISIQIIFKTVFIIILSILILSTFLAWQKPLIVDSQKHTQKIDQIIATIVIGGLLAIYSLFLLLQLEYLLVNSLPIDFGQTERLVKSGFWQLFFLSTLNVILFTVFYKNTAAIAQILLTIFIIASGLLLLSAAWRMGLYVFTYGLSYEKFFASYTSLFALILFVFLVIASLEKNKKDILKTILFSALWCYSIATLLPIEKIILHSNTYLSKQEDSRIDLVHLKVLSADVLSDVNDLHAKSIKAKPTVNGFSIYNSWNNLYWQQWMNQQKRFACSRAWYEKNFSLIINCY